MMNKADTAGVSPFEEGSRRKVQSVIKTWMEHLEELPGWRQLPPMILHKVRRAIVRVAWSAYRVGLLTKFEGDEDG